MDENAVINHSAIKSLCHACVFSSKARCNICT